MSNFARIFRFHHKISNELITKEFFLNSRIKLSVSNINRELNQSSLLDQSLIKVDFDNVLRSMELQYTGIRIKDVKVSHEITFKKNDNPFITLKGELFGQVKRLRENMNELPRTSLGASIFIKALENKGAASATLDLESSQSMGSHKAELHFKTENLIKIVTRVISCNARLVRTNEQFDGQLEVKQLGEVKAFKVFTTSGLRGKEFDVGYEKKLASGQTISASGVGSIRFSSFKDFETSVNVPGHYSHKFTVENSREPSQQGFFATHKFNFVNKHLDYEPIENRFQFEVENKPENVEFVFDARKGSVGLLDEDVAVDSLGLVSSKNVFYPSGGLQKSSNKIGLKSFSFNLNMAESLDLSIDEVTKDFHLETKADFKVPALITDPGKVNYLKHEAVFTRSAQQAKLMNRFDTDSKLFGGVFRLLNVDYVRETTKDNGFSLVYEVEYFN